MGKVTQTTDYLYSFRGLAIGLFQQSMIFYHQCRQGHTLYQLPRWNNLRCHRFPNHNDCLVVNKNKAVLIPYLAIPYPNRAKSPFNGSSGKISDIFCVRRRAADIVAEPHLSSPNLCDSDSTWVSNGMMSVRRSIKSAHRPRSTGEPLRTIHRRNMHTRLQADCASCGTMLRTPFVAK